MKTKARPRKQKKDTRQELQIFLSFEGDRSVGIWGWEHELTIKGLGLDLYSEKDMREGLREGLRSLFADLEDDTSCAVRFADECPDCFRKGCKGECCDIPEDTD